ncbi:M15 family metallopeptidase [Bradyrhizobium sp. RDM4]|uniref:M15 family metallopeptidase n=1 Tax=Bradyrhizobium sp. RDM4 TaxID=3378765 RepID=UPI0038FCE138
MQWPRDNEAALIAFYGNPGPEVERQLVKIVPPFQMYYSKKPLKYLLFHKKAASALAAALEDIWQASGKSQAKLDHDGVSSTAGTYCCRKIAGSTRWSNHAFGGAIDLDAEHNGFFAGKGTIPQYAIDAFDKVGFRWGGRYSGRTDPMHFEACDDGRPHPATFVDLPLPEGDFAPFDGEAQVKGVAFADVEDHEDEEATRDGDGDAPSSPGFFGRVRNWVTGGASTLGIGGLGALTDWQIAALLLGFVLVVILGAFGLALWLFGKDRVADWISRHIA